jgi:hypothetical protein
MTDGVPTGTIQTAGVTGRWEDITPYDALVHEVADPVGWPIIRVRSTIAIESAGDPRAMQRNASNGDSHGLLQVVPFGVGWEGWHELVRQKAGLPRNAGRQQVIDALYRPEINIPVGVAILEGFYQQYGTLDRANSAFFLGNPFWEGEDTVNGNSGDWYRETLHALIVEQEAFAPPDVIGRIGGWGAVLGAVWLRHAEHRRQRRGAEVLRLRGGAWDGCRPQAHGSRYQRAARDADLLSAARRGALRRQPGVRRLGTELRLVS